MKRKIAVVCSTFNIQADLKLALQPIGDRNEVEILYLVGKRGLEDAIAMNDINAIIVVDVNETLQGKVRELYTVMQISVPLLFVYMTTEPFQLEGVKHVKVVSFWNALVEISKTTLGEST